MLGLIGVLALVAALACTWWYAKAKRPSIVLLAGVLFLLAFVAFWRSFIPAGERHPWMK